MKKIYYDFIDWCFPWFLNTLSCDHCFTHSGIFFEGHMSEWNVFLKYDDIDYDSMEPLTPIAPARSMLDGRMMRDQENSFALTYSKTSEELQ